ncbi:MAG: glycosyltransferase family 2 protein [Bacteroidales bacterium]
MLDISVIILTFNEEIHIKRCIERIAPIAKNIFVIDCFSTDNTAEIANKLGAVVVTHAWPGNHAAQINWALDNLPIDTQWVLRLDADEYLTDELIDELYTKLPVIHKSVSAIILPLKRIFMGREIKHGTTNIKIIRIFRFGSVRCEQRWMDEYMTILKGDSITLCHKFVDDNLETLAHFTDKHNGYSIKEAIVLLDKEFNILNKEINTIGIIPKRQRVKRAYKSAYANLPLFWRAFFYFCFRYIVKGGFIDGKEGFLWHFLQGWWYRTLVDNKIFEIKKHCGEDKEKMIEYIRQNYKIEI